MFSSVQPGGIERPQPLVEKHDAIEARVEEAAVQRLGSGCPDRRAERRREAARVAALLDMEHMRAADRQPLLGKGSSAGYRLMKIMIWRLSGSGPAVAP